MRKLLFGGILWLIATGAAAAEGERAGEFDYYVLSLSWSPNWCAAEGDARGAEQCAPGRALGWVVHGLWPQFEEGWPSYCRTTEPPPSRSLTGAQADIFGAGGAAWYQWKKHGVCSGLTAEAYYDLVRQAYDLVVRPEVLRKLETSVRLPATVIEEAFLQANPGWKPDMLTITCRANRIQEARLCLTKELEPRICARDVRTDCRAQKAILDPVR